MPAIIDEKARSGFEFMAESTMVDGDVISHFLYDAKPSIYVFEIVYH